jgi:hypothetical protein
MTNLQQLRDDQSRLIYNFQESLKDVDIQVNESFKAGQQDMLERVRGVIPEEVKQTEYIRNHAMQPHSTDTLTKAIRKGFNACREETLKALDNLPNNMTNINQCNIKEPHSHLVQGKTFECEKGQSGVTSIENLDVKIIRFFNATPVYRDAGEWVKFINEILQTEQTRIAEEVEKIKTIFEKIKLREYEIEAEAVREQKVYNATTQSWAVTGLKYIYEVLSIIKQGK